MFSRILKPVKTLVLPSNYYQGKNILITGGGSGLGKQMAIQYAQLDGNVTVVGRKEDKLIKTSILSNKIDYHILDVRKEKEIENLANKLESENKFPDIVINNAAGNFISRSHTLSNNAWNTIIDIVLKGTVNMTSEFGRRMINNEKNGIFLNISTTYAQTGSAFVVPSAISKAGCDTLTKSLAAEWGKYGIRCLSIAPGPIYTRGAFSRLDPDGRFSNLAKKKLPLGRFGEKEEIANLATFLTSDYNNWMTGQIINFDGGEVVGNSGEFNGLHMLSDKDWDKLL
mgnify:CR=1 FL=1